jgi:hypothetical protein
MGQLRGRRATAKPAGRGAPGLGAGDDLPDGRVEVPRERDGLLAQRGLVRLAGRVLAGGEHQAPHHAVAAGRRLVPGSEAGERAGGRFAELHRGEERRVPRLVADGEYPALAQGRGHHRAAVHHERGPAAESHRAGAGRLVARQSPTSTACTPSTRSA